MSAILDREMTYAEMAEQSRLLAAAESMEANAHDLYAQAHDVEAAVNPEYAESAGSDRKFAGQCRQRAARHLADYQTYLAKAEKEAMTASYAKAMTRLVPIDPKEGE
jgi:hypothetical protein